MQPPPSIDCRRILVIDDNSAIHGDFRKILPTTAASDPLAAAEAEFFADAPVGPNPAQAIFEIDDAYQGEEGLQLVTQALAAGRPYAMAFVDVRMPPGIDGVETAERLWAIDPDLQVVICTAYSDFAWTDMVRRMGCSDRWVVMKKPFDNIEVQQIATALTQKWQLIQRTKSNAAELEARVAARTRELADALSRLERETADRIRLERSLAESHHHESLGAVARGVAHDFNNLNATILLSTGFMRLLDCAPSTLEALQQIDASVRRGSELCQLLLLYAGHHVFDPEPLDVVAHARDCVAELSAARTDPLAVEGEAPSNRWFVHADAGRIRQIWTQLIQNAAEASGKQSAPIGVAFLEIELDAAALAALSKPERAVPGKFVRCTVRDQAGGLSAEAERHVFEPFFSTKFLGRGLGLCAALGIVRGHGGAMDHCRTAKGMDFHFFLPLEPNAAGLLPGSDAKAAPALSAVG